MSLPAHRAWLLDEAHASPTPAHFIAHLGRLLLAADIPLAGGTLSLHIKDPIVAHRSWLWRPDAPEVIESIGLSADTEGRDALQWLSALGNVREDVMGPRDDPFRLGWACSRPLRPGDEEVFRDVARHALAPISAISARMSSAALLEVYLGRRSARRVEASTMRRGTSERIHAVLLCADLRDFTALSETAEPPAVMSLLDGWFDCAAGAIHAFGGEVLKFIGDGVLAVFPVQDEPGRACLTALQAVNAMRAGMSYLNADRGRRGLPPLAFGTALHLGEILWGNVGAANRLDFTAIGPAVNLVSRLEGLCRPLDCPVLLSEVFALACPATLAPLGEFALRGVRQRCSVFTLPELVPSHPTEGARGCEL